MSDALTTLLVDETEFARDEIAPALEPYVRLTRDGGLLLEPGFDALPTELRVLCVLVALQALKMLGVRATNDVTPAELVEISGMPEGTVRPKLSALHKAHRVSKDAGRYSLPMHSARRAMAALAEARRG
ncbi:MAG TPA: hypothetical protein VF520_07205 [Thermoleophilaceae bacterium]|jgi:hypothetical protein